MINIKKIFNTTSYSKLFKIARKKHIIYLSSQKLIKIKVEEANLICVIYHINNDKTSKLVALK